MPFTFKLSQRLARMWRCAPSPFLAVLPVVDASTKLHSDYLLKAAVLYVLWKGTPALWRAVEPRLIVKYESLPFPNRRRWYVPPDKLRRWTDPDRVTMVNLPLFRDRHRVVYLGLRGVRPVIRKQ